MDKKIRAAAENDTHAFEENNWKKMEVLLDKHLPEKKRRRRVIFLFLLPAIAIFGFLLVNQLSQEKKPVSKQQDIPVSSSGTAEPGTVTADKSNNDNKKNIGENAEKTLKTDDTKTAGNTSGDQPVTPFNNKNAKTATIKQSPKAGMLKEEQSLVSNQPATKSPITTRKQKPAYEINKLERIKTNKEKNPATDLVTSNSALPDKVEKSLPATTADSFATLPPPVADKADKNKEAPDSSATAANNPPKKEINPKKKGSKFSFNFSLGPDLSSVRFAHPGEFRMQYGIGIGYAISKRLAVRTGLYAGHKIYSADSSDYHMVQSGTYSYRLYDVNANCFVYEIPVSLVYNFKESKNHSWFVSAGLSSYIMNKEDYVYSYKNSWGQTMQHQYSYKNKNAHFFSVLGISGGYQYNFNRRFSILAEPYIKLPYTGIGAGRVRLNSTGILFTASLRPFAK